jgi:hypothetical protein
VSAALAYGWALIIIGVILGNTDVDLPRVPAEYDALAAYLIASVSAIAGMVVLAVAAIAGELSKRQPRERTPVGPEHL